MNTQSIKGAIQSNAIYDFYHHRIDSMEEENKENNRIIDTLIIPVQEQHSTEWELKKRREEIAQLHQVAT